jgi:hypothetical protein
LRFTENSKKDLTTISANAYIYHKEIEETMKTIQIQFNINKVWWWQVWMKGPARGTALF